MQMQKFIGFIHETSSRLFILQKCIKILNFRIFRLRKKRVAPSDTENAEGSNVEVQQDVEEPEKTEKPDVKTLLQTKYNELGK